MESCRFVHQAAVLLSVSVRQVVASSLVFELGTPANPLPVLWLLSLLLLLDERLQWHVQVACRCSSLLLMLQLRRSVQPRFFHRILFARSLSTFLIALFSSGWAAGFSSTALLLLLSLLLLHLSSLSLLLLALLLLLPLL
jgi:hypothetical protein